MRYHLTLAALLTLAACGGTEEQDVNAAAEGTETATSSDSSSEATAPQPARVRLRSGEWEITSEMAAMNVPGMPKGMVPNLANKNTFRSCISEEQAADPDADVFSGRPDANCSREGFLVTDGRVKGTVTCTGEQGAMEMAIDGSYAPESYDVTMDMKSDRMTMQVRTTGKRIGECPAG